MPRGWFITFEGPDGSGKTTQLKLLEGQIRAGDRLVVTLRQPGGTALGARLRSVLLDSRSESALGPIAPIAELALMFADRAQALAEVIEPALDSGYVVLCDRFTDSSEAYQGGGRGLGSERVLALHRAVCGDLQPDLTVLLLPPLASSLRRARRRNQRHRDHTGRDENRFEAETDAFYARVDQAYRTLAAREPGRVVLIQSEGSIDEINKLVLAAVTGRLALPIEQA